MRAATLSLACITVMAAACWLAGLAVPFLKGVAKLLLVPITREFNLPLFLSYLVREDQGMTAVLLAVPMVLAPALLLLWLAALLAPRRRLLATGAVQRGGCTTIAP